MPNIKGQPIIGTGVFSGYEFVECKKESCKECEFGPPNKCKVANECCKQAPEYGFRNKSIHGNWKRIQPASEAAVYETPIAWLHVLDNTDGVKGAIPMKVLSFSPENPFGTSGVDYSNTYKVTCIPLKPIKEVVG